MAKKPNPELALMDDAETLLASLVREANGPPGDDASGPDFTERLKVVDTVTRFLTVKHKLLPPEKQVSELARMRDELHGRTSRNRTLAPAATAANGHAADPTFDDGEL